MAENTERLQGKDKLLWLLIILIAVGAFFGNIYWLKLNEWSKWGYFVATLLVMLMTFALTAQSRQLIEFYKEARIELRKVVWPEKQETVRDTGRIIAVVLLVGVVLWIIDRLLFWVVSNLTYL